MEYRVWEIFCHESTAALEQVSQKDCNTSVLEGFLTDSWTKLAELILLHMGGWSRDHQRTRWWICERPADQDHFSLACSSLVHVQKL